MSELLPMFPLQLVVFPEESLNLHIFEPRYQELVKDCETEGITFGIPTNINGKLMEIGTEIRLQKVEKRYASGESDIRTRGMGLFSIKQFYPQAPGKLYAGAEIERLPLDLTESTEINEQILEKTASLFDLLEVNKTLPEIVEGFSVYEIAHHIGLTLKQEYELLCITDAGKRQEYVLNHLTGLIPVVKQMEALKERARMNGHFKRIIPPSQPPEF